MNRWLLAISAAVLGLVMLPAASVAAKSASPAPAQTLGLDTGAGGGKAQPVAISADNGIEWRQADQVYIARGNVKAVRGNVTVYADEMRAYYRPVADKTGAKRPAKEPKPQTAADASPQPKPAKPSKPPKAGQQQPSGGEMNEGPTEVYRLEAIGNVRFVTPTQTGYGDHADYDVDKTLLVLTGKHMEVVTPHDRLTARDSIEWYDNRQLGVARGDAVDLHDGKTLAGDILLATIVHPPGEEAHASRIDGRGHVFVSSKDQIGRGDTGVYDANTGVVTLSGHVRLTRGKDEMRGNYGVVDVNRNIGYLLPRPPGNRMAGESSRRVQALIVPDKKNGAPNAAGPKKKKTETAGSTDQ